MESNTERVVYTIGEIASILRISRPTARRLISEGQIRTVRAGKRVIIPIAALNAYLAGEPK